MSSAIALHFSKLAFVLFITATQGFVRINILKISFIFLLIKQFRLQKVNITKFENCVDVGEVKVNLTSVQYDYNDEGICDTIHGKYYVHTIDSRINYEVSNSRRKQNSMI